MSENQKKTKLIDIGKDRNLSLDYLERELDSHEQTEKILVVSVWSYGTRPDLHRLHSLKAKFGFKLLEDRCLARPLIPEEFCDLNMNTDAYLFSTGYSKYCDLHYGGWLLDSLEAKSVVNNRNMNVDGYFHTIASRRKIVDLQKEAVNNILETTIKNIAITDWKADRWRLCVEVQRPELLKKFVELQGGFCSNHYCTRHYQDDQTFSTLEFHQKHVINFFNDLRVGQRYCENIIEAACEYQNALHNSCEIGQQENYK